MTAFAVACLAVVIFAAVLAVTKIGRTAGMAVRLSTDGVSAIFDRDLGEDEKEARVRQSGLGLLVVAWGTAWRLAACLIGAAAPIYLADLAGLVSADAVLGVMLRLDFIVLVSLVLIGAVWLWRRRRPVPAGEGAGGEDAYSAGDRMVHVLAFSSPLVMKALARRDAARAAGTVDRFEHGAPLFVTSLARGGTTALLNALSGEPGLGSYLYRDMPFPTAPYMWSRLSGSEREVVRRQRAHGDGLEIGLDSPEAFDEVLWMLGWPGHYRRDRIDPWGRQETAPGARDLLRGTFARVAALRASERGLSEGARLHYLSKNNANIARIELLAAMFPGATVAVVLRQPGAHALSLWRQHQRFLKIHAEEDFTRRYMRDIGHFEFGALHRPIAFEGFDPDAHDPAGPDYWLSYWVAAFTHVAARRDACILVSQDRLRAAPDRTMRALLDRASVSPVQTDFTGFFHAHADTFDRGRFSPDLLARAEALHADLEADAL